MTKQEEIYELLTGWLETHLVSTNWLQQFFPNIELNVCIQNNEFHKEGDYLIDCEGTNNQDERVWLELVIAEDRYQSLTPEDYAQIQKAFEQLILDNDNMADGEVASCDDNHTIIFDLIYW